MECHHIDPDGGDSFDNCIPLCFDCHAEVRHYDDDHPKGVKFTGGELKGHRDAWFKKVDVGIADAAPAEHMALDRELFHRIHKLLGGSEEMTHFRDHDYGASYPREIEKRLIKFVHYSSLPEWEFFSLPMEEAYADLKATVREYRAKAVNRIWFEPDGMAGIPAEWVYDEKESQRQRFDEAEKVMNAEATKIWDAYCQFVRQARRTLHVDLTEAVVP